MRTNVSSLIWNLYNSRTYPSVDNIDYLLLQIQDFTNPMVIKDENQSSFAIQNDTTISPVVFCAPSRVTLTYYRIPKKCRLYRKHPSYYYLFRYLNRSSFIKIEINSTEYLVGLGGIFTIDYSPLLLFCSKVEYTDTAFIRSKLLYIDTSILLSPTYSKFYNYLRKYVIPILKDIEVEIVMRDLQKFIQQSTPKNNIMDVNNYVEDILYTRRNSLISGDTCSVSSSYINR